MTILFGGSQMEANYVVIDGTLYGALSGNAWSNLGQASDIWDPTGLLNADVGLANLLTNFANPQVRADEMVDGVNTVRVDGTVTADAVNKIFPELAANAPVPSTAWIRPDTDALVQLTLQPHAGQSIQFNLSAWGKAVTITRPPGV